MYIYVCITESFSYTVEINTTLLINYTKIHLKKFVPQRHTAHIVIYAAAAAAKSLQSCLSDSVRPHRQQPTRLLCPGDSSGKNTPITDFTFLPRTQWGLGTL